MNLRPKISLLTLLLAECGLGVFLWWARFETIEMREKPSRPQARLIFYWIWEPRGFVNISAYHHYGDTVHLQIWPKCCKYPFAYVEAQNGYLFIQWPVFRGGAKDVQRTAIR